MVHAYILVQTEVGQAAAVAKEIGEIRGVVAAEDVTGPYDVIVRAEADDVDNLGRLVVAKVQACARYHPHAHLPGGQPGLRRPTEAGAQHCEPPHPIQEV